MKGTGTVLVFTNSGTSAYILPYVVDTGPVSVGPGEIEPHFQRSLTGFRANQPGIRKHHKAVFGHLG